MIVLIDASIGNGPGPPAEQWVAELAGVPGLDVRWIDWRRCDDPTQRLMLASIRTAICLAGVAVTEQIEPLQKAGFPATRIAHPDDPDATRFDVDGGPTVRCFDVRQCVDTPAVTAAIRRIVNDRNTPVVSLTAERPAVSGNALLSTPADTSGAATPSPPPSAPPEGSVATGDSSRAGEQATETSPDRNSPPSDHQINDWIDELGNV